MNSVVCTTDLSPSEIAIISPPPGDCCGSAVFETNTIWVTKDCKFQNQTYLEGPTTLQVGMVILATNGNCYRIAGLAPNVPPDVIFQEIFDGACSDCINAQGGTPD